MMISLTALAVMLVGSSSTIGTARAQDPADYHVETRDGQFVAGCTPFKVAGFNAWYVEC